MATNSPSLAPKADYQEILRFLRLISPEGCVSEIRILKAVIEEYRSPHTIAGYFDHDHLEQAASQIAEIQNGRGSSARGVYVTLNPVIPSIHARAYNRLKPAEKDGLTKDTEIESIRTLILDFDPLRPSGISSSEPEHKHAYQLALSVKLALSKNGFPPPVLLNSGNGWHLLYRLHLTNDVENTKLIQQLVDAVSSRFSSDDVVIDIQVFNPSRITKVAGTLVCKGDWTPERPRRVSYMEEVPNTWEIVPRDALEKCIVEFAPSVGNRTPLEADQRHCFSDFATSAARSGFSLKGPQSWKDGSRWTMLCPWRADDGESVYIVDTGTGYFAGCWHKTCPGSREKGNQWQALQRIVLGDSEVSNAQMESESKNNALPGNRQISCVSELPSVWDLSAELRWLVEDVLALGSVTPHMFGERDRKNVVGLLYSRVRRPRRVVPWAVSQKVPGALSRWRESTVCS